MAYEQAKDRKLSEEKVTVGDIVIICGLYQYDNGPVKYGETRVIKRGGKDTFAPIGRKTIEEMKAIAPAMVKLVNGYKQEVSAKADTSKPTAPKFSF